MNNPQRIYRGPGAYRVGGTDDDGFQDDESQNQSSLVTVQVSGQVVNEEEEEERKHQIAKEINERREHELREAQSRINDFEQQPKAHASPASESEESDQTLSSDSEQPDRQGYQMTILVAVGMGIVGFVVAVLFLSDVIGKDDGPPQSDSGAPSIEPSSMSPSLSPLESDDSWVQLGDTDTLKGEAAGDRFGLSVALSMDGSVLVASGRLGNVRAFRYDRETSQWDQVGRSINLEGRKGGVALSGNGTTIAAISTTDSSVKVHVFAYDILSDEWSQIGLIMLTEGDFGWSVALSADGDIVAASAAGRDDDGKFFSGVVQVHQHNATTGQWDRMGQVLKGESARDYFGYSISLSTDGLVLASGAPEDATLGFVRVFTYVHSEDEWLQLGTDLEGIEIDDDFGYSVALSANGTHLVSGGQMLNRNGGFSGFVWAHGYNAEENRWDQIGQVIFGEPFDYMGSSVSLTPDGMVMAVGATSNARLLDEPGRVLVFRYNVSSDEWMQIGPALIGDEADDLFGWSVALSAGGDVLAVGSYGGDADALGYVRVFNGSELL